LTNGNEGVTDGMAPRMCSPSHVDTTYWRGG